MIKVHDNIFVGSLLDYEELRDDISYAFVQACKEPSHRELVGYSKHLKPNHPEYLYAEKENRFAINIVDSDKAKYFSIPLFQAPVAFINNHLEKGRKILIHCNLGESRSPSIALFYLALIGVIKKSSYSEATKDFSDYYPKYKPNKGIKTFLENNWHRLFKFPKEEVVISDKTDNLIGSQEKIFIPNHSDRDVIIDEEKAIRLFMYEMKNRDNFIDRDHPKNISPESAYFKSYWRKKQKEFIEGKWINDEGTWIYMYPSLCSFIDYISVKGPSGKVVQAELTTNEWVAFSYWFSGSGFSGFLGDDKYSCNYLLYKIHKNIPLSEIEKNRSLENIKNKDGEYKIYVDPWEYLSRVYHYDDPRDFPLGQPLYENDMENSFTFGGRDVRKSFSLFMGRFTHYWMIGDVKRLEDSHNCSEKHLFGLYSGKSDPLVKTLQNIADFYDNQPGQFEYPNRKKQVYKGPFYKYITGTWDDDQVVRHKVRDSSNSFDLLNKSLVQIKSISEKNTILGTGGRYLAMLFEEAPFIPFLKKVYVNNRDSLINQGRQIGRMFFIGTSGVDDITQDGLDMFFNPKSFRIKSMPNYYENTSQSIGLFMATYYRFHELYDENGNINYEKALKHSIYVANKHKLNGTKAEESHNKFNPIYPKQMKIKSGLKYLPSDLANRRKIVLDIDLQDTYDYIVQTGQIVEDKNKSNGVRFVREFSSQVRQITKWGQSKDEFNIEGYVNIYDKPSEDPHEDLYTLIFDPVKNDGLMGSLNGAIMYRYFELGNPSVFDDNIVADWIGRHSDVRDTYWHIIRFAKLYNAKILVERDVPGFIKWAQDHGFVEMLIVETNEFKLESKRTKIRFGNIKYGFRIGTGAVKNWVIGNLNSMLREPIEHDDITGLPTLRWIDKMYSKYGLDEIFNYDLRNGNYDYVSAMAGIPLRRAQLGNKTPIIYNEEQDEFDIARTEADRSNKRRRNKIRRSRITKIV